MPGFTANRSYPYSVPADPADVPQAIQDLAEAIDVDLTQITAGPNQRPMAVLRGTQNRTVPPGSLSVPFVWDAVDYNNGAVDPATLGGDTIQLTDNGLWLVVATVVCPPSVGAGLLSYGLSIQGVGGAQAAETLVHNFPAAVETAGRTLPASNLVVAGPGAGIRIEGLLVRSANNNPYTYREQTAMVLRMYDVP